MKNASKYLLVPIALLAGAAAVNAARPDYRQRLSDLEAQATQKRDAQHLDYNTACAKLHAGIGGTPEVRFERAIPAHPGETVAISATGRFLTDATLVPHRDEVKVASMKLEKDHLTAKLAVGKDTLPGEVYVELAGSLCPSNLSGHALNVVAGTDWKLKFENGWQLALSCQPNQDRDAACASVWTGGGKTKNVDARVSFQSEGPAEVDVGLTPEEQDAFQKKMEAVMAESQKQMEVMQGMMAKCNDLAQNAQIECMGKVMNSDKMKKMQADNQARSGELEVQMTGLGCQKLELQAQNGVVTAQGEKCVGGKDVKGQGTVAVKAP